MSHFDYLIPKIEAAEFTYSPFRHLEIFDLFEDHDFHLIQTSSEVSVKEATGDEDLIDKLLDVGYKIVLFPGSSLSRKEYIEWHANRVEGGRYHPTCEGFGLTLRLMSPVTPFILELDTFLRSDPFNHALANKFGIDLLDCRIESGIQKYLDGYEISPHPDVRAKALTFMVNINPGPDSSTLEHHTHLMKFTEERAYVEKFWVDNPYIDRCWVPWGWCESEKKQSYNNSMVIFSPDNDTIHAVKANYNHLNHQRTQLYGNLWYKQHTVTEKRRWEELDTLSTSSVYKQSENPKVINQKDKLSAVSTGERDFIAEDIFQSSLD
jgi:hypothetical protein